jgi:type II restriction enzyme
MARRKPRASSTDATLADAKDRLDRLIRNARDQSLMPITIAETLHRLAADKASLGEPDRIRKDSYHWCQAICERLFCKPLSLNRSYWDKLFASHMPPDALAALNAENRRTKGVVEAYVYARLRQTVEGLQAVRAMIVSAEPAAFSLDAFLAAFEKERRLRRSIDKAYEIAVHALFNAVAARVQARITVSVATTDATILADFRDFCQVLLGVSDTQPEITIPARLYRVGGTNSRDGGVDLWANFGPAVQVKHITLDEESAAPLADSVGAV